MLVRHVAILQWLKKKESHWILELRFKFSFLTSGLAVPGVSYSVSLHCPLSLRLSEMLHLRLMQVSQSLKANSCYCQRSKWTRKPVNEWATTKECLSWKNSIPYVCISSSGLASLVWSHHPEKHQLWLSLHTFELLRWHCAFIKNFFWVPFLVNLQQKLPGKVISTFFYIFVCLDGWLIGSVFVLNSQTMFEISVYFMRWWFSKWVGNCFSLFGEPHAGSWEIFHLS